MVHNNMLKDLQFLKYFMCSGGRGKRAVSVSVSDLFPLNYYMISPSQKKIPSQETSRVEITTLQALPRTKPT